MKNSRPLSGLEDHETFRFRDVSVGRDAPAENLSPATTAAYEDKIANLERALRSNRRIGIAIGIVMSRYRCADDEAFDMLRSLSQQHNRKLRDLAEEVIYIGALPD